MEWQRVMLECSSSLYVCEMPHAQSVASAALVRVGTRDENWPKEAGMAHAFEHMAFHGAGPFSDSGSLALEVEKTGGRLNAWTGGESTAFHNRVPSEYVQTALYVLSQQIYHPRLPENKLATEINNIIQEIKRGKDNPSSRVGKLFQKALYNEHDLGKDTLGSEESLCLLTIDDFTSFHLRFYHPGNFVFVLAGAVKKKTAQGILNANAVASEFFGGRVVTSRTTEAANIVSAPDIIEERDIEQAKVMVGWLMPPASARETKALRIFCNMIDGGMGFPLFQEVRDKLGLCYSISAGTSSHTDVSSFYVYVGTEAGRINEAIDAICRVIDKHKTDPYFLLKVKDMVSGAIRLRSESTSGVLMAALGALDKGMEPQSLDERLKEVRSITIEEVEVAVNQFLTRDKMVKAMVVPRGFALKS